MNISQFFSREMSVARRRLYEFSDFRLDALKRVLLREEVPVPLPPKVFDLLLILVESNNQELRKSDLMDRLWPDSYVEESNLTQSIFLLRRALGQRHGENRFIVTIPGRGYRFVEEVRRIGAEKPDSDSSEVLNHQPTETLPTPKSIAVLPFRLLGTATEEIYLGLGMADALINRLSHLKQIVVRPTSAIVNYTDPGLDPLVTGRELGVDSLLTGQIQRVSEGIRVTVQLVRIRDGSVVWAEKFDEHFTGIFAVQDSISEQVAAALALKLSGEEQMRVTRHRTEHPEAYQAYLKGRYYSTKWTESGWRKGIQYFHQAIEADPDYAPAYAGLAEAYYIVSNLYLPPREAIPKAKDAAMKALAVDDSLAEAHTSMALVRAFYDWDWVEAEKEFRRAIEMTANNASARLWFGRYLATMGRFEESIAELNQAQQLDPLSPSVNAELSRTFLYSRQYDRAIAQLQETLDLDPDFWPAHLFLGWAYEQKGLFTEAIAILRNASTLDGNPRTLASLGHAYAVAGQKGLAQKVLRDLIELSNVGYVSPYYIAGIHLGLREKDLTFTWLEKAYEDRSEWLVWLKVDPRFDSLRQDPRLADLLRRVGLAP